MEGNSLRATSRMTGAAKNTVTKLLVDIGQAAADYQDDHLQMLPCEVVEADEIWAYCYAQEQKRPRAIQGDPRLRRRVDVHRDLRRYQAGPDLAGRRADLRRRGSFPARPRLADGGRIQLSTDGHSMYIATVGRAFGNEVDWARIQKDYVSDPAAGGKYSPPVCVGTKRVPDGGRTR